ncbi:hypothetical protein FVE85_9252 [Porphyridium purpureum]|uniref:PWWP domain-containing protein n=1 Tax=Porphyridium purpureum TaxID=35688 RepID=A0A5J4YPT1_PORPP|nr:hypothetical protein FVE85_9252 [Porphyridium purpureum]|eukprot:POR9382..scf222_8
MKHEDTLRASRSSSESDAAALRPPPFLLAAAVQSSGLEEESDGVTFVQESIRRKPKRARARAHRNTVSGAANEAPIDLTQTSSSSSERGQAKLVAVATGTAKKRRNPMKMSRETVDLTQSEERVPMSPKAAPFPSGGVLQKSCLRSQRRLPRPWFVPVPKRSSIVSHAPDDAETADEPACARRRVGGLESTASHTRAEKRAEKDQLRSPLELAKATRNRATGYGSKDRIIEPVDHANRSPSNKSPAKAACCTGENDSSSGRRRRRVREAESNGTDSDDELKRPAWASQTGRKSRRVSDVVLSTSEPCPEPSQSSSASSSELGSEEERDLLTRIEKRKENGTLTGTDSTSAPADSWMDERVAALGVPSGVVARRRNEMVRRESNVDAFLAERKVKVEKQQQIAELRRQIADSTADQGGTFENILKSIGAGSDQDGLRESRESWEPNDGARHVLLNSQASEQLGEEELDIAKQTLVRKLLEQWVDLTCTARSVRSGMATPWSNICDRPKSVFFMYAEMSLTSNEADCAFWHATRAFHDSDIEQETAAGKYYYLLGLLFSHGQCAPLPSGRKGVVPDRSASYTFDLLKGASGSSKSVWTALLGMSIGVGESAREYLSELLVMDSSVHAEAGGNRAFSERCGIRVGRWMVLSSLRLAYLIAHCPLEDHTVMTDLVQDALWLVFLVVALNQMRTHHALVSGIAHWVATLLLRTLPRWTEHESLLHAVHNLLYPPVHFEEADALVVNGVAMDTISFLLRNVSGAWTIRRNLILELLSLQVHGKRAEHALAQAPRSELLAYLVGCVDIAVGRFTGDPSEYRQMERELDTALTLLIDLSFVGELSPKQRGLLTRLLKALQRVSHCISLDRTEKCIPVKLKLALFMRFSQHNNCTQDTDSDNEHGRETSSDEERDSDKAPSRPKEEETETIPEAINAEVVRGDELARSNDKNAKLVIGKNPSRDSPKSARIALQSRASTQSPFEETTSRIVPTFIEAPVPKLAPSEIESRLEAVLDASSDGKDGAHALEKSSQGEIVERDAAEKGGASRNHSRNSPSHSSNAGTCAPVSRVLDGKVKLGSVAWGKVRGFPWWPGVVLPNVKSRQWIHPKTGRIWLQFFGHDQGAWLQASRNELAEFSLAECAIEGKLPSASHKDYEQIRGAVEDAREWLAEVETTAADHVLDMAKTFFGWYASDFDADGAQDKSAAALEERNGAQDHQNAGESQQKAEDDPLDGNVQPSDAEGKNSKQAESSAQGLALATLRGSTPESGEAKKSFPRCSLS